MEQCSDLVQAWLRERYPAIAPRAKAEGAVIYWADETARGFELDPRFCAGGTHAGAGDLSTVGQAVDDLYDHQPRGYLVLTIMVVAATPEDERDFGVEGVGGRGRKSFWRLDPVSNVTRRTDSHPGLLL